MDDAPTTIMPQRRRPVALRVITNSEMKAERRCRRLHYYRYVLGYIALVTSEALRLGALVHLGLEAWWRAIMLDPNCDPYPNALETMLMTGDADPYLVVRAEVMLLGYHQRWWKEAEAFDVLGVELQFAAPMVNPDTGQRSRTFMTAGKLDVLLRDVVGVYSAAGDVVFMEHKSSVEDITSGSRYWRRLRVDSQVGVYFPGADSLVGADAHVGACVWDVLRKSQLRPGKATPVENRTYTKPKTRLCPECRKKAPPPLPHVIDGITCSPGEDLGDVTAAPRRVLVVDPGGRLHAGQRDADETVEEFRARLMADLVDDAALYASFVRQPVVRTAAELNEAQRDVWQQAAIIRESGQGAGRYPRNPDACTLYGRDCDYLEVCSLGGEEMLRDPAKFRRVEDPHVELTPAVSE